MAAAAGSGFSTATDLADWLVRELDLPFREAHHVTGRIVAAAEASGVAARQAAAGGHAGGRARASPRTCFRVLSVRQFGGEPDQLWGNCATERPQNGASLDKAVGKGPRPGLERIGIDRPRSDRLSRRPYGVATYEQGSTGLMTRSRLQLGVVLGLIALGTFSLSGCGVRGSLEPPPKASPHDRRGRSPARRPDPPKPHEPSILDPLIR